MPLPNEKTTAPCPAVGAVGEQSNGRQTKGSITENAVFSKGGSHQLDTISMVELYDTTYPPKAVLIHNLLYAGTYLFVGAPKVGKSFFMAQLSHHIATGRSLWQFPVNQGEVLYLALEDDRARIQKRLYMMFGTESTEHLHFATHAMTLCGGLCQQLEDFVAEHTNTRLVIVDTLQKVREVGNDKYSYGSDYEIVAQLKAFSDKHNLCLLVVHHTRKMESEDSFEMISGTNGLLGAADGAFILQKKKRTDNQATLSIVGRDQQDLELHLEFDRERCIWKFIKAETAVSKPKPDAVLDAVAKLLTPLVPQWIGAPADLLAALPDVKLLPHHLTRHLNANTDRLFNEHGVTYENIRTHDGRVVTLTLNKPL